MGIYLTVYIISLIGAFTIWRVYLNPLKTKVYTMDRELGEVKATVMRVERDVERLVDALLKKKKTG